jgi:hypothetical protein
MTQDEIRAHRERIERMRAETVGAVTRFAADALLVLAMQCGHPRRATARVLGRAVTECCDCGAELTPTPSLNLYPAVVEEDDTDNDDAWVRGGG